MGGDHLEAFLSSLPPGYRFNPDDDELVNFYLRKKLLNEPLPPNRILETNVYDHNPDKLHEMGPNYGEKERYYFTTRKRKSAKGNRPDRNAGTGFWKASTKREVLAGNKQVGTKRSLVFHEGNPSNAKKTNWLMQEFTLVEHDKDQLDLVLCKIYYNDDKDTTYKKRKHGDEEPVDEHIGGEGFLTDYQIEHIDTSDYKDEQKKEIWLQKEDVFVQVAPENNHEKKNGDELALEKSDDQDIVNEEKEIWFNVEDILSAESKNENGGGEDFLMDYQIEHIDTSDYKDDQKEESWLQKEDVFLPVALEKKNGDELALEKSDDQGIVSDEKEIWLNVEDILFLTS